MKDRAVEWRSGVGDTSENRRKMEPESLQQVDRLQTAAGEIAFNEAVRRKEAARRCMAQVAEALHILKDFPGRCPQDHHPDAGHNVGELPKHARDPLTYNDPLRVVVRKIQEYPAPVLAMIEGGVWGGSVRVGNGMRHGHRGRERHVRHHPYQVRRTLQPQRHPEHDGFGAVGCCERNALPSHTDQRAEGVRSWNRKLCPIRRATGSEDVRVSTGYARQLVIGHYLAEGRDSRIGSRPGTQR
jgi:hypothetical protein